MVRRRRLINDRDHIVSQMIEGYTAAHPHIIRTDEHGNVVRAVPKERGKVGLVIGNGSGHEPAMIGWIGWIGWLGWIGWMARRSIVTDATARRGDCGERSRGGSRGLPSAGSLPASWPAMMAA